MPQVSHRADACGIRTSSHKAFDSSFSCGNFGRLRMRGATVASDYILFERYQIRCTSGETSNPDFRHKLARSIVPTGGCDATKSNMSIGWRIPPAGSRELPSVDLVAKFGWTANSVKVGLWPPPRREK